MAYEYDRFEREDGGGAFLMGLLAGTVLGAGLGMLFAPKAGTDLRNQLSESANKLQRAGTDAYQQASEKVTNIVERGREAYDKARSTATQAASSAADSSREIFGGREAAGRGSDEYAGAAGSNSPGGSNEIGATTFPGTPGSRTTL